MFTVTKFGLGNVFLGLAMFLGASLVHAAPVIEVIDVAEVELQCVDYDTITVSEDMRPAEPGVTYTATMLGLREQGRPELIVPEHGSGFFVKANNGDNESLDVDLEVRCSISKILHKISYAGATASCNEGEGIRVQFLAPECIDDAGHYTAKVQLLKTTRHEDEEDSKPEEQAVENKDVAIEIGGIDLNENSPLVDHPEGNHIVKGSCCGCGCVIL
jgi:hypothetical protein